MTLEDVMRERREKALAVVDDIDWTLEQVECDDYGDIHWRWHTDYTLDGDHIWEEYWHDKPSDTNIYNTLLEAIKDGPASDRIADLLGQRDNYDKMIDERK